MRAAEGSTVVRLRRWLLVMAVVVAAGMAGVLGYARYRTRHIAARLPKLLGANIRSETNGFTYSQSLKGRTLFTIHASKAIQRTDGKTTLRDVDITLYSEPGTQRTDRIRGAEFEYDQPNGVIQATGTVRLDLTLPAAKVDAGPQSRPGERHMEVTTSGLVFLEKLGVAATEQPISFRYGAASGNARGAEYDADTGMLRLRHDVQMSDPSAAQPLHLNASAAELDRQSRRAVLHDAQVLAGPQTLSAHSINLLLRGDGSVETLEGDGSVELANGAGERVRAPRLAVAVNGENRVQTVHLQGGVEYAGKGRTASSAEAAMLLDAAGRPVHLTLVHRVRMEQLSATPGLGQTLTAERVDTDLKSGRDSRTFATGAVATGKVTFISTHAPSAGGTSASKTTLQAETLRAVFTSRDGQSYLQQLHGNGGTRFDENDGKGVQRSSSGDSLVLVLRDGAKASGEAAIRSARQQGNVVITETRLPPPETQNGNSHATSSQATSSRATADLAEYDGITQQLVLTGSPQVTGAGVQLAAASIGLSRSNGNATASGMVKASYASGGAAGTTPAWTHVVADHAEMADGNRRLTFTGNGERRARLWTRESQLEAPVIQLDREAGRLTAHGAEPSASAPVLAVLSSASHGEDGKPDRLMASGPIRISSRDLLWTQATPSQPGQAVFNGGVRVDEAGAVLTSNTATAYLQPGERGRSATMQSTSPTLTGAVERIVATGDVRLRQPGRTAKGETLTYTAADGAFALTGTGTQKPEIVDAARGSITGSALLFHTGDDRVDVSGSPGTRVRSETLVKGAMGRSN